MLAAVPDEPAKIMSGNRGDGERCAVTVAMALVAAMAKVRIYNNLET